MVDAILALRRKAGMGALARPRLADAAHLRAFRAEYGKRSRAGLLLHTGASLEWLAPDVLAAPWWEVL
ncbi:MAG: hypothetical protein ACT4P3_18895 [Betaproteobacteria bacterium]